MINYRTPLIVITILILLITGLMGPDVQEVLALIFILSIGLIHGAHDMFLLKRMKKAEFSWLKVGARYLLMGAVFGILYLIAPLFPVVVFVFFSAYHFGEQHWLARIKTPRPAQIVFAFSYGLLIIGLLLRLNFQETYLILLELVSFEVSEIILNGVLGFAVLSLIVSGYLSFNSEVQIRKRWTKEILIIALLTLVFAQSKIIWGFAVYFVFWHSIPSIVSQLKFMYGGFSWKKTLLYFKRSFGYWLVSVAGIGILFYYLGDQRQMLLSVLLLFIGAFTFPHGLVISSMLREKA